MVFSFNLRNYTFQSAKKCEMASFYKTSLHVDLNEAAKCVDIMLASFSRLRTLVHELRTKYNMATIFGLTYEDS